MFSQNGAKFRASGYDLGDKSQAWFGSELESHGFGNNLVFFGVDLRGTQGLKFLEEGAKINGLKS